MMNTVAPVWDGNETWMVLGGAGLFAAFPMVYSAVLSALYLPIILMVIALIFAVSLLSSDLGESNQILMGCCFYWRFCFIKFLTRCHSGAYIQGIHVIDGRYAGGGLDWLTPFSVFTGFGVIIVYAALGCGWLIMKTEMQLQTSMYRLMPKLIMTLLLVFIAVSVYTPLAHPVLQHVGSMRISFFTLVRYLFWS